MPLIAAGIVPHTPLLLKTVGKEYSNQTKKTQQALASFCHELLAMQPDVVCIIHPHGAIAPDRFLVLTSDSIGKVDLSEFGDMVTTTAWPFATTLAQLVAETAGSHGFPYHLSAEHSLTYDIGVPLEFFPRQHASFKILPISICPSLDRMTHVNWGTLLAEAFHETALRVVVLASAELSSHVSASAAGGIRPEGTRFDQYLIATLKKDDRVSRLVALDETTVTLAESCGFLPALVLSGILKRKGVAMQRLSYEHPFGIGFLVASFLNV